jgi:hypothetical protein
MLKRQETPSFKYSKIKYPRQEEALQQQQTEGREFEYNSPYYLRNIVGSLGELTFA